MFLFNLNSSLEWKLHGAKIGTDEFQLPESFNEPFVVVRAGESSVNLTVQIPKIALTDTYALFDLTSSFSATNNYLCAQIRASLTNLSLVWATRGSEDLESTSFIAVYYR